MATELKTKRSRLICSVMGCKNTETYFVFKNGVVYNTPNLCKECIKLAYLALCAEDEINEDVKSEESEDITASEEAKDETEPEIKKLPIRRHRKKE